MVPIQAHVLFLRQSRPAKPGKSCWRSTSDAVRRQLISDVPVGLLLSGGVDSGLLLALDESATGSSWPTYTVGYGSTFADDELADAAETARIAGIEAHQRHNFAERLSKRRFPRSLRAWKSRSPASSIVPMYFVCERARQDVKVALVGQGPDELFGGYRRHLGVRYGAHVGAAAQLDANTAISSAIAHSAEK